MRETAFLVFLGATSALLSMTLFWPGIPNNVWPAPALFGVVTVVLMPKNYLTNEDN